MLPELPSLRQLKDYLNEQSLVTKCQTDATDIFAAFADGNSLDVQSSYGRSAVDARFWFDFNEAENSFVIKVNYFTYDGIGITKAQFVEVFPAPNIAAIYEGDYVLRWTHRQNNVYEIASAEDSGIYRYFNQHIPTITKIA